MIYGKKYNELVKEDFTIYKFKDPLFDDGFIRYEYDEWILHTIIMDFEMNVEKTKGMTEEEKQDIYEKNFIHDCKWSMACNIARKLESMNALYHDSVDGTDIYLDLTIPYFPKELYPNLVEWINDEPLSNIKFHGISLKKMIDLMDFPKEDEWQKYFKTFEDYQRVKARSYLSIFKHIAFYNKWHTFDDATKAYVRMESMNTFRRI